MQPPFYKRKIFWDDTELVCVLAAAIAAFFIALVPPDRRTVPSIVAGAISVVVVICRLVARKLDRREKAEYAAQAKRMVGALLDVLHDRYFRKEKGEEKHKHRVTLFVYDEGDAARGIGKHLRIFARAGVHKDSDRIWPVDENDQKKCRGIAAQIWFTKTALSKTAACDWPENGDARLKADYAESLEITVAEAEHLHVKSRYFAGTPILVAGRRWGVLLLDSRNPGFIDETSYQQTLLNQYTTIVCDVVAEIEA